MEHTITIPACSEHSGFHKITATVPWRCIYCDGERGAPRSGFSYDGSRRLIVTMWSNPCGHTETYEAVRQWLRAQKDIQEIANADNE
jgi:hypothetical protein